MGSPYLDTLTCSEATKQTGFGVPLGSQNGTSPPSAECLPFDQPLKKMVPWKQGACFRRGIGGFSCWHFQPPPLAPKHRRLRDRAKLRRGPPGWGVQVAWFPLLGPPARCPFSTLFWLGGFPYSNSLQRKGYPYSNLSTGGPSLFNQGPISVETCGSVGLMAPNMAGSSCFFWGKFLFGLLGSQREPTGWGFPQLKTPAYLYI